MHQVSLPICSGERRDRTHLRDPIVELERARAVDEAPVSPRSAQPFSERANVRDHQADKPAKVGRALTKRSWEARSRRCSPFHHDGPGHGSVKLVLRCILEDESTYLYVQRPTRCPLRRGSLHDTRGTKKSTEHSADHPAVTRDRRRGRYEGLKLRGKEGRGAR